MAYTRGTKGTTLDDKLQAYDTKDTMWGYKGNDTLLGEGGNDTINGGDGNDTIDGGGDNDTLLGGIGNDDIYGGKGSDILKGEADRDILEGGSGADYYYGGAGSDTYKLVDNEAVADYLVFNNSDCSTTSIIDKVENFTSGEDKIDLSAFKLGLSGASGFLANSGPVTFDGNNLRIDLGNNGSTEIAVTFVGVDALSVYDFIW